MKDLGYSMNTGVLPVGQLPHALRRDNRYFGERRLSLLVICLENQGNDSSNEHAELKNPIPCNHNRHPLSFTIGGKRSITREKIEGNRLPGYYWQHHGQHITRFDRFTRETLVEVMRKHPTQQNSPAAHICAAGIGFFIAFSPNQPASRCLSTR